MIDVTLFTSNGVTKQLACELRQFRCYHSHCISDLKELEYSLKPTNISYLASAVL